jgi:hypothetical protein
MIAAGLEGMWVRASNFGTAGRLLWFALVAGLLFELGRYAVGRRRVSPR